MILPNALNVSVRVSSPSIAYVPLRVLLERVHENDESELNVNENAPEEIPTFVNADANFVSICDVASVPAASVRVLSLSRRTAGES